MVDGGPFPKPVREAQTGQFRKGRSGNPGGRTKALKDGRQAMAAECQKLWPQMLAVTKSIALDPYQKVNARISAVKMIFHWGFGKPTQNVEVEVTVDSIFNMPDHERASKLQAIISLAEERQRAEAARTVNGTSSTVTDVEDETVAK